MKERLYDAMNDFLDVVEQLEDIQKTLILQREGLMEMVTIEKTQITSVLNIENRLLEKAIQNSYDVHLKINKILLDMK